MPKRQFDEMVDAFYSTVLSSDAQVMSNLGIWTLAWIFRQEEIDERDKQIEELLQKLQTPK